MKPPHGFQGQNTPGGNNPPPNSGTPVVHKAKKPQSDDSTWVLVMGVVVGLGVGVAGTVMFFVYRNKSEGAATAKSASR
jgi:hypothetical protein